MSKKGFAELPLHGGACPRWLFSRMTSLSGAISEIIVDEYGTQEFLQRMSDPFWFQGFACAIGFDWHSSGVTTTVTGALKEALKKKNLEIHVCGGKGAASRKTPQEIQTLSEKPEKLVQASKLTAKVDNSLIQDHYKLYHHAFLFDNKNWAVIQQGMNERTKTARRYHWFSDIKSFIEEPHKAICCNQKELQALNLTSKISTSNRNATLDLVKDGPGHLEKELKMPSHHFIQASDLPKTSWNVLQKAYEIQPKNYEELVSIKGMGPKTIRALALISELVYSAPVSWKDPVKYSFAHGGKDGTPYPVNKTHYDKTIEALKEAINNAKLGNKEKMHAIKGLHRFLQ